MNTWHKRTLATITAGAMLGAPAALLVSAPAHADVERSGACGGGRYELSVDRENGGFEVNADLDGVARGSKWKVVLRHDGQRFAKVTRLADREGDIDIERFRRNTSGQDTFTMRAERVGGQAACRTSITIG